MPPAPAILLATALLLIAGCARPATPEMNGIRPLPTRMRGAAILAYAFRPEVVRAMAADGINTVRLQIDARPLGAPPEPPPGDPLLPYRDDLAWLHASLPVCAELGLAVIVSPGNVPGRKLDVLWKEADDNRRFRDHLPAFWDAFAREFARYPAIVAYDVFNEPNYQPGGEGLWYRDMLPRSVAAIRAINREVWLVVEPGPWAFPEGFADLPVLDDPRVVYSLHHYYPHGYTHQHLRSREVAAVPRDRVYPGALRMFYDHEKHRPEHWDRTTMRRYLEPVVAFQRRTGARILVGEFGTIRWAPGAARWLEDSVSLFEELGWDWLAIGYPAPDSQASPTGERVWTGWNLGYAADDPRVDGPYLGGTGSDRLEMLRRGWSLNRTH